MLNDLKSKLKGFLSLSPKKSNEALLKARIENLIENGERIVVDLTQCEIKQHTYSEERNLYDDSGIGGRMQAMNAMGGFHMHNIENIQIVQSVFIFHYAKHSTAEQEKFISPVISKDRVTLMIYLDKQRETMLYVDKSNRKEYYFDLQFLQSTFA